MKANQTTATDSTSAYSQYTEHASGSAISPFHPQQLHGVRPALSYKGKSTAAVVADNNNDNNNNDDTYSVSSRMSLSSTTDGIDVLGLDPVGDELGLTMTNSGELGVGAAFDAFESFGSGVADHDQFHTFQTLTRDPPTRARRSQTKPDAVRADRSREVGAGTRVGV